MILDDIKNQDRYKLFHPLFPEAFDFINKNDLLNLTDGKHEIKGDELFAIISRNGNSDPVSKLEAHKKYIDIHFAVNGSDTIGWKALGDCELPVDKFNVDNDYILYNDIDFIKVPLTQNKFMIVYPEDAHAPLLHTKDLFKLVLKIKL
jgi:YhcH/YjgK/YiaL family protein